MMIDKLEAMDGVNDGDECTEEQEALVKLPGDGLFADFEQLRAGAPSKLPVAEELARYLVQPKSVQAIKFWVNSLQVVVYL